MAKLWSQSPDYRRRNSSEDTASSAPKRLNRSLTISGETGKDFMKLHAKQHPRDSESPLERFSQAKKDMAHYFELLQSRLVESQKFVCLMHGQEQKSGEDGPVKNLQVQAEGIADLLRRDHMKVAFFGRTSNGKSTVINSLLRENVLPSGMGHTTNCFCSVVGVDESEGYLCTPSSKERQNVKNVRQLAHSMHKERLDPNSLVKIFWPKTKCPLLSGEVELVDSPGIDMNPDLDQWITNYCLDADVFVLVSNAESTLMTAEKNFFHRVSERLSKPNIFILNNRWDLSAQEEPDMMEEVMKQHLRADIHFLSKELEVVSEQTAKDRVFFVSAKEVLQVRTKLQPGTVAEEEGHGLADGWKLRVMAFERFEKLFKECVSNTAILTKFEQHYNKGLKIVDKLEEVLAIEMEQLTTQSEKLEVEKRDLMVKSDKFRSVGQKEQQTCQHEVEATVSLLDQELQRALHKLEKKVLGVVQKYDKLQLERLDFVDQMAAYQLSLCEHLDEEMCRDMEQLYAHTLVRKYEDTKNNLITKYCSLLGLPEDNLHHSYQLTGTPPFSLSFKCTELCQDFKADTVFNFWRSIGISGHWLKDTLNLETVLGGVYSRISQVLSFVPTEYVIPITLVGGTVMLPRLFNWRVWLISLGVYGSLYTWKWSTFDPKTAFQKQFAAHVGSKLHERASVSCNGYRKQVDGGLNLLMKSLKGELAKVESSTNKAIKELTKEAERCSNLQQTAKGLKNNVHLLKNDFETFKDDHLTR